MMRNSRLLRLILRLAPSDFRSRHADEYIITCDERAAAASRRGGFGAFVHTVRELGGTAWLVLRLRMEASTGPRAAASTRESTRNSVISRSGYRSSRVRHWLGAGFQDLRFAARALRRDPGYTVLAVLVLALGIGATAAIFSAVNAFFFRPLPFAAADRLVMLYETNPEFGWVDAQAAPANVLDWRDQVEAFDDVAAYSDFTSRITFIDEGEPHLLSGVAVTGNFFSVLGARAALGRTFTWNETWDGAHQVVVLSHDVWVTRFGADPSVVDRTYEFGARRARVIGVMPPGFSYPTAGTQLWYPWGWTPESRDAAWFRRAHFVRAIARLAAVVPHEDADAQLRVVVGRLQTNFPETNSVMGAGMMPLRDFLIRDVRRPLLILLGAVGLLLLLACANVANLTLVRGAARSRELALRHALGASRRRVAGLLLAESLLLAFVGGTVGIGVSLLAVRAMSALTPLGIDGATTVALDARVLTFTLAVTAFCAILFGLAPALRRSVDRIRRVLMESGTGATAGRASVRAGNALIIAEVALALLLVVGGGLMTRSFLHMRDVDPGFRTEGVLAVQFTVPPTRYQSRDDVLGFQDRIIEALEARAGIERAGFVAQLPLTESSWSSQFQAAGWPPERVGFEILHRRADVGYFDALGIPLIRGRLFEARDHADAPLVVLINETFARDHFPGEDPLGQRIAYDRAAGPESTWYEIIGIVGDQHQVSPAQAARAEAFESRHQDWGRGGWLVLRTTAPPMSMVPVVRAVLNELDPLIPIAEARPLHEVWRASMAREEFILALLAAFGVLALLLAAVGVYGVTAQAARRRTRELGIRIALGARGADIVRMMLRQSMTTVAVGLAAGLGMALVAAKTLRTVLFGVAPGDPLTLTVVVAVLATVAAIACYLPARRALRLDPLRSLKDD
jgi:putative ABC transport system permease protein